MADIKSLQSSAVTPPGGLVSADQITIVGDGAGNPLAATGVLPPQPFDVTTITINARTTGSDTTGDGSLDNPYATLQRSVLDVPQIIAPGNVYNINITGISETLPADYTLPPWKAGYTLDEFLPNDLFRTFNAAVNIFADLQQAVLSPASDAILNVGDVLSQVQDPTTKLITLTLNVARTSWGTNNLRGMFVRDATGGNNVAVISSNSTTVLHLTTTATLTLPIQIMTTGATIRGTSEANVDPAGGARGCFRAVNIDSIEFSGLDIANSAGPTQFGLAFGGSGAMCAQNCKLTSPDLQASGTVPCRNPNNWILGAPAFRMEGGNFFLFRSLLDNWTKPSGQLITGLGGFAIAQCFVDTCITLVATIGNPANPANNLNIAPINWILENTTIYHTPSNANSTGDGIDITGGSSILQNVAIINCARDGVRMFGNRGSLTLDTVGSPFGAAPIGGTAGGVNAGWGLNVIDGNLARANTGTYSNASTLLGTLGAITCGGVPGETAAITAATWGAWIAAGKNLFDIQAVGAGGATGSGSQVVGF